MVSYYDIRAAQKAARALHGRLLRGRKLDIRYSIPKENPKENSSEGALWVNNLDSSISNEELHGIFSSYGEIREVCLLVFSLFFLYDIDGYVILL
jgi:RNA recognition motif-containing protein